MLNLITQRSVVQIHPPQPNELIESKQVKREPGKSAPFLFAQTVRELSGFLVGSAILHCTVAGIVKSCAFSTVPLR
jgi:hypothetical protein